ncbi:DoxX family protein [Nitratireductor sp. ZSWI3]|uniref:DoxX family protein n=1 Tax=Nitratireductor sp. ZSWI3 TaxID=2966359 RepID=UPI0021501BF8|nr:DoxX family protein [Nitratireductor sp. ZSWI3]MCR4268206.1 DoxX family protein [Nitratireductor sp. ZSWI3]
MPETILPLLHLAGRLLLGGAFVFAGLRNLGNIPYLTGVIAGRGMPLPRMALIAGISLQCIAGALLIAGLWTRFAALGLILFLLVATVLFHNFWDHQGPERVARINGIVSNAALAGSFLLVLASG